MNKECSGCISFNNGFRECQLTKLGTEDIPNCPCKICLVKVTCKNECNNFLSNKLTYDKILSFPRRNLGK